MKVAIIATDAERADPGFHELAHRAFHAALDPMEKGDGKTPGKRVAALEELTALVENTHRKAIGGLFNAR